MKRRSVGTIAVILCLGMLAASAIAQDAEWNVTGKWAFSVTTSAGAGNPNIELKQEGEKLTGHYSGQLGEADISGTVKGKNITFNFIVDVSGYTLNTTYKGTLETKDSMKGTLNIEGLGEGTFTAKRQ